MTASEFSELFPNYSHCFGTFDQLARLVEEKSKVINITAIRDYEGIWEKHIVDSLEVTKSPVLQKILSTDEIKILDVGTGAGFPGLALATAYPNAAVTLCDATRKKLDVINEFTSTLQLQNAQTVWGRAEELARSPEYRGMYDVVVARALAYLPKVLQLLALFTKKGGYIVAYKLDTQEEIQAGDAVLSALRLQKVEEYRYTLPHGTDARIILVYQKL